MDSKKILAVLIVVREAFKARKAANGNGSPDVIVETIMPELTGLFASLFKNDADGLLPALNSLVLALYEYSGDELQAAIRLMANANAEALQRRHPWLSLPVMIFIQGYFNALEAEATRNGDNPPTRDDLLDASHRVAEKMQIASSDLGKKFNAAKAWAMSDTTPHTYPVHGGAMPEPDDDEEGFANEPTDERDAASPGPVPAAGGTRTRKKGPGFVDRVTGLFDGLSDSAADTVRKVAFFGDRGEDIVQSVASAAFSAFILLLVAVVSVGVALLLGFNAMWMAIVIIVNSVLLVVVPLIGFTILRGEAREVAERMRDLETNPYEKAGNGFLEGGGLVLTIAFVGGASLPLIAFLCTVGAYHSFAWEYLVTGLVAIALGSLLLGLGDVGFDAVKALVRGVLPEKWEGEELKLKNRIARSFSRVGIAYCVFTLPIVFIGMMEHTLYTRFGASFPVLFLGLFMWFVDINTTTAPDAQPVKRSRWSWVMAVVSMMAPGLVLYSINTFIFPPECPDKDESAETVEECKPLSYADRLKAWYAEPAKGSGTNSDNEVVQVEAPVPDSCSPGVKSLMEGMEKDGCKVVLEQNEDQQLVSRCKEAIECKALLSDGSKRRVVAFRKVTPQDSGIIGELLDSMGCLGISIVAILVVGTLAFIGRKGPAAEKKNR